VTLSGIGCWVLKGFQWREIVKSMYFATMNSFTEENYLKAMYHLADERGEVSVNELSKQLGLKMPTVNSMMKKLAEKKLVHYESYKPLRLTTRGKKEAALVVRKHRLTEMFLVEKMGFGWEEVHEIAEQVEHIQSFAFFEKMDELLGHPTSDPHGSPIPDKQGNVHWQQYGKLSDGHQGDRLRLAAVTQSSDEFLKYLNARHIRLNMTLTVKSKEGFDGSMVIEFGNKRRETLSKVVCERMLVVAEI
jgi:DtxR family transcriptional regulator, Mn-dependent transcriptional regulator